MDDTVAAMGKRLVTYLIGCWLLTIAGAAHASDAQHQSNRCSALFMILTSIQNVEAGLGQYFTQLGEFSTIMTAHYYEERTGKIATNGKLSVLKSKAMDNIRKQYLRDYRAIENEIESCIGWAAEVGNFIKQNSYLMKTDKGTKTILKSAPKPSKNFVYPFDDFASIQPFLRKGFDEWINIGSVTPEKILASTKLNELIERQGKFYRKFSNEPFTGDVEVDVERQQFQSGSLVNGVREGEWLTFREDGSLQLRENYEQGFLEMSETFSADGDLETKSEFYTLENHQGKLAEKVFYEDGAPVVTEVYTVFGTRELRLIQIKGGSIYDYDLQLFGPSDELESEARYIDNKMNGLARYFAAGQIVAEGQRKDHLMVGDWTLFNEDGTTNKIVTFDNSNSVTQYEDKQKEILDFSRQARRSWKGNGVEDECKFLGSTLLKWLC